jgi:hypothetical protein
MLPPRPRLLSPRVYVPPRCAPPRKAPFCPPRGPNGVVAGGLLLFCVPAKLPRGVLAPRNGAPLLRPPRLPPLPRGGGVDIDAVLWLRDGHALVAGNLRRDTLEERRERISKVRSTQRISALHAQKIRRSWSCRWRGCWLTKEDRTVERQEAPKLGPAGS